MAITQTIGPFPPAPSAGTDTPEAFASKADAWVSYQEDPYTTDVNTLSGEMNTLANEVNDDASSSGTNAANAQISEDNAKTSETNAATSESNASASEGAADTSASNAATSESNASTSESNAATSEANAGTSAAAALVSEQNAASSEHSASSAANYQGEWLISTSYVIGESVSSDGTFYYCKVDNSGLDPALNPTEWQVGGASTTYAGLEDVNLAGQIDGSIQYWDSVALKYKPSSIVYKTDKLTTPNIQMDGEYLSPYTTKNKLINGGFDIWQRGTDFSDNEYTADRWGLYKGSGDMSVYKSDVSPDYLGDSRLRLQVNTPDANAQIYQKIEDVRTLQGTTATLSFWINTSQNFKIEVKQSYGTGSPDGQLTFHSENTTNIVASTWAKVEMQIDIPALTTEDVQDSSFLQVALFIGANTGNTYIKYIQLEEGSVATPFEQLPIGQTLSLCQRYCQKFSCNRVNGNFISFGARGESGTVATITGAFQVQPRLLGDSVGTLTKSGNMAVDGYAGDGNNISSFTHRIHSNSFEILLTTTASVTGGGLYNFNGVDGAYFLLEMEL